MDLSRPRRQAVEAETADVRTELAALTRSLPELEEEAHRAAAAAATAVARAAAAEDARRAAERARHRSEARAEALERAVAEARGNPGAAAPRGCARRGRAAG